MITDRLLFLFVEICALDYNEMNRSLYDRGDARRLVRNSCCTETVKQTEISCFSICSLNGS